MQIILRFFMISLDIAMMLVAITFSLFPRDVPADIDKTIIYKRFGAMCFSAYILLFVLVQIIVNIIVRTIKNKGSNANYPRWLTNVLNGVNAYRTANYLYYCFFSGLAILHSLQMGTPVLQWFEGLDLTMIISFFSIYIGIDSVINIFCREN